MHLAADLSFAHGFQQLADPRAGLQIELPQ
jgi:hypothetical protein